MTIGAPQTLQPFPSILFCFQLLVRRRKTSTLSIQRYCSPNAYFVGPFFSLFMVLVFLYFVLVRVLTSWYAFLLSFFLMLSSISCHCTSIQDSFAFFMLFLNSWLIALYFLAPSAVSCLPFLNALRSSHRSSMLVATHGLLTVLRLPKISLAYSVNALLKEFTSVSTSVSSASSKVSGANLPPIIARIGRHLQVEDLWASEDRT